MASRPVKIKTLPRSVMRFKSATRFAASVEGVDPISVTKSGNVYTISSSAQIFPTRADAAAATVTVGQTFIQVMGYATANDCPPLHYTLVSAAPTTHSEYLTTANGLIYELREFRPTLRQMGAQSSTTVSATAAMNRLIAYARAMGLGEVFLEDGYWAMSVVVTGSALQIVGNGAGTVVLNNSTNFAAFGFGDGTGGTTVGASGSSNGLRNMVIAQSGSVTPDGVNNVAVFLRNQSNFLMQDVYITNSPGQPTHGLTQNYCFDTSLIRVTCNRMALDGITTLGCNTVYFNNTSCSNCDGNGVVFYNSLGVYGLHVRSEGNSRGFVFGDNGGASNFDFFGFDWVADGSLHENWRLESLVQGNFDQPWGSGATPTNRDFGSPTWDVDACGFLLIGDGVQFVRFNNGIALNNNRSGVRTMADGSGNTPVNIIWNNFAAGPDSPTNTGNGVIAGTGYGFEFADSANKYTILGGDATINQTGAVSAGTVPNLVVRDLRGYSASTTALSARQVISGAGLTGGGDLSTDRTLAVGAGTGITVNADDVALDTSNARNVDHSAVWITAGTGLTGGGTIAATRTLSLTVSGLTAAAAAADADTFPTDQGGGPLKQTLAAIKTWIKAWITKTDVGLGNVPNTDATNASNISSGTLPAGRMPALTGDITTSAGAVATTLATVNSNVGTFGSATQVAQVTVNGKGQTTAVANVTVTPAIGSVTGLGTGVATALGNNVGSAGAPVTFNGAGGTPSSITLTNATGNATGLTAGNVGTNANLTGPITSVGNATSIASQTGTGTKFVVDTSPTLVTPNIGVATATSVNKVAVTAPATSATLTIADGTTLTQTTSTSVGRGQYQATNTNDSATAGNIGEILTASATSVSLVSTTGKTITSVSLTAGDWDVWAAFLFVPTGGSASILIGEISPTDNTTPTTLGNYLRAESISAGNYAATTPVVTVSLASTTTYYAAATGVFAGTCPTSAKIVARRRR